MEHGFAASALLELLWPTRCVGCDAPDHLLCDDCKELVPVIEQQYACPYCGAPYGFLTCTECDNLPDEHGFSCIAAVEFEGLGARLIRAYKDAHERRLASVIANYMARGLRKAASQTDEAGRPRLDIHNIDALVFIPSTEEAYLRRGFDHMEAIARELSRFCGVPVLDCLIKFSKQDQRDLNKDSRQENLRGTVQVIRDVSGLRLVLIDDVCTTGATLKEGTETLLSRGAAQVTSLVFARVW